MFLLTTFSETTEQTGKIQRMRLYALYKGGWINPTGPSSGTRRVNRGGGWNDFGKNLRSAYRAAVEQNTPLYNVGLRLVCNADDSVKGTVTTTEIKSSANTTVKKALIIYYSWSGNTRGVAKEIARQTGFDSIELELVKPYSTDYNTVLNEAQRDQHKQVRPALKTKIDPKKWAEYDTIIIATLTGGQASRCRLQHY